MSLIRKTLISLNILSRRNLCVTSLLNKNGTLSVIDDDKDHQTISRSMTLYKKKASEQKKFMDDKLIEYDIGKRHLANMMGEDVDTFTQDDIDEAIQYLLPSGLFQKRARPCMKHPHEIFPKLKNAEFDNKGRPLHTLFYTAQPKYYQLLQDISIKARELDMMIKKQQLQDEKPGFKYSIEQQTLDLGGSHWINEERLQDILFEKMHTKDYDFFVTSMNRLVSHSMSFREEKFIRQFREIDLDLTTDVDSIPEMMYTDLGIPYITHELKVRKALASATIYARGTGKISINGTDIRFFDNHQEREQIIFPLQFTGLLNRVDLVATSSPCPESWHMEDRKRKMGQAYGIRHCISYCLRSFVPQSMLQKMKMAGLLTHDVRKKERQKPGRRRARARYTWNKR